MELTQSPISKVYAAITVDGDLRLGDHHQQAAGVRAIREVHEELQIIGRTSWLINEYDFRWSEVHQELLRVLLNSEEALGIHDHFDTYFAETYEEYYQIAHESKARLGRTLKELGWEGELEIHRNGCALQSIPAYRALGDLGYWILSDVWPETAWRAREIAVEDPIMPWRYLTGEDENTIPMDNSMVPLSASPWRHEADNWLEYQSNEGRFLQVPITTMPWVDRERVFKAVEGPGEGSWIVLDTHPYDLQDPNTGDVDPERVLRYKKDLQWIQSTFHPEFVKLDEIPQLLQGGLDKI